MPDEFLAEDLELKVGVVESLAAAVASLSAADRALAVAKVSWIGLSKRMYDLTATISVSVSILTSQYYSKNHACIAQYFEARLDSELVS